MFRVLIAVCLLLSQFEPAGALTPGQRTAILSGGPAWFVALTRQAGVKPSPGTCNAKKNQCWTGAGFQSVASAVTVSRASPETCADLSGNYTQVGNNVPCVTNAGVGVWEGRTNSIRTNNYTDPTNGAIASDGIELVTNGLFGTQASPTLTGWTDKSTGTGSSSAVGTVGNMGSVALAGGASGIGAVEQSFSVVSGTTYTLQFSAETNTTAYTVGKTSGGTDYLNSSQGAAAQRNVSFTANATGTVFLRFKNAANNTANALAVSVQAFRYPVNLNGFIANGGRGCNAWVTAVGTTNGIPWYRIRFVSNSTNLATNVNLYTEGSTQIVVTPGQTLTQGNFLALSAGSLTNISAVRNNGVERTSVGGSLVGSSGPDIKGSLTSTLTRFPFSQTVGVVAGAVTVARLQPGPIIVFNSASPVDVSIDTGFAQTELNPLINATVASVNSIGSGGTGGTYAVNDVLTGAGFTGTAPTFTVTSVSSGVITGISLTSAGSASATPVNPIATTGGGGTGATINLLYTDNSAQGFATPPILTTNAAVARAANVPTLTSPPTFGGVYTLLSVGTPQAPTGYPITQQALNIAKDVSNNWTIRRDSLAGTAQVRGFAAGSGFGPGALATWAQGSSGRVAGAYVTGAQASSFNGGAVQTSASGLTPTTPTIVNIGNQNSSTQQFNGVIQGWAIWSNTALPNTALQNVNINYLLRRDVTPANDNRPMFLEVAA